MERRELLALVGAGTASLWVGGPARAGNDDPHADHEHLKTIGECALVCNMTAHHCLEKLEKEDSKHRDVHANVLQLTNDCATFCVQAATLMARRSPLAAYAHKACAEACHDCAEACDKGHGEMMKKCAEACRACEKACRACCAKTA